MTTLAARLKFARKRRGYSSAVALGKVAGVSASSISNIEAGLRVGASTLIAVAKVLRVHIDWLRDGNGEEPDWDSDKAPAPSLLSWRALEIAEIFDSITNPEVADKAYAVMVAFDERGQQAPEKDSLAAPAQDSPPSKPAGKSLQPTASPNRGR